MSKPLHIVSFDIPWPANYGGVIAVFSLLKALHQVGARIHLHCFQYGGRTPQPELLRYCEAVYYYPRSRAFWHQLSREPFIVRTRKSPLLLQRLLQDDYPILFEGLHTAGWISHPALSQRRKVVRMHNIEWHYYAHLARSSASLLPRGFFTVERWRLRRAEAHLLSAADAIVALSPAERAYFERYAAATYYVPVLHPYERVSGVPGRGQYALFHGKLSVPDNERAALWLIEEVFDRVNVPLVVAGMAPSKRLQRAVARRPHVTLVADPDAAQMDALVREAHVHVLHSFQPTGVKLKLFAVLFNGRHCIANEHALAGTSLHSLCALTHTAADVRQAVVALMATPWTEADRALRARVLETHYSNTANARRLLAIALGADEPYGVPKV